MRGVISIVFLIIFWFLKFQVGFFILIIIRLNRYFVFSFYSQHADN